MLELKNVNSFYDKMLAFIDHAVAEEFIPAHVKSQIVVDADPKQLLMKMGLA